MTKRKPPALFVHFPKLFWRDISHPESMDPILYEPFPADLEPHFSGDLRVLRKYLLPDYVAEDREALSSQNEYRRDQVILIIGGIIATGLAALPAAAQAPGWSVLAAVFTAFLASWAARSRDLASQERWRTSRLKAELLRSEYFLFLGRAVPYDDDTCRTRNLKRRVAEIRSGGAG